MSTGALEVAGDGRLARDTAVITALNALSRVTGFVRVLAMGAALGTTALGDAYQAANLVSNVLFELLAGGVLAAVLVPQFVQRLRAGDDDGVAALSGVLVGRAVVLLGVVVLVMMAAAPAIMAVLVSGADEGSRDAQAELGSFLLLFFLPQIVLYAVGAVSTALLQAERRFAVAAAAPVANNLVVIATMVAFRAARGDRVDLALSGGEKLLLAGGTSLGVLAMSVLPSIVAARAGRLGRPRWRAPGIDLGPLLRRGIWAAGHLGFNQLLVAATVVFAAATSGGVVAYQIAFTFFLLPHAVLANPVFTALYPRLAADADADRLDDFARRLSNGIGVTLVVLAPAAAGLVAVADPAMGIVRLGNLDAAGAALVADVLRAYAIGLAGYSAFFLLTRAAYALDDVVAPAVCNGVAVGLGVLGMAASTSVTSDNARVAALGIVHAIVVSGAAVALHLRVRARLQRAVPVLATLGRVLVAGIAAGLAGRVAADAVGGVGRGDAVLALVVGSVTVLGVYVATLAVGGRSELARLRDSLVGTR